MNRTLTTLLLAALASTSQAADPTETHTALPKAQAMFDHLNRFLPPEQKAIAALDSHPKVREARLKSESRSAEAKVIRENPHEWEAGMALRNRKDRTANTMNGSTQDQEVSLSRSLRLPGKQKIQERQASSIETLANYELGDAMHEASLSLGKNWLECQRLESRAALYTQLEGELQQFASQQKKRLKAGEVSRVEATQADLLLQQLRIEQQQNQAALRTQRSQLKLEFPSLLAASENRQCGDVQLQASSVPDQTAPIQLSDSEQDEWVRTMLSVNHPLLIQASHTEILRAQKALAGAERLADPKVGVSFAREQNNAEQIIGVHISLPFGGSLRNNRLQLAQSELGQAEIALQALQASSREEAMRNIDTWQQTRLVADAAWNQAQFSESLMKSLEKAYWLGEATATELTLARQQAQRSRIDAIDREYEAIQAQTNLLVNAHQAWD